MPRRHEPTLEELVNRSDPEDDDYDDMEPRSRRPAKRSKTKPKKASRKRKRDSDDDLDDESELSEEEDDLSDDFEDEIEDPNAERNARGSVKRRVATKKVSYVESSGEEDEIEEEIEDKEDAEDEEKEIQSKKGKKRKLIVKFPIRQQQPTPQPPTSGRATRSRARSASVQYQEPVSTRQSTRRSTRLAHDDKEDIVALSGSGRHVETIRRGTRSPDPVISHPPRQANQLSHVEEEEADGDEPRIPKDEEDDDHVEHIGASQVEIMESDHQGGFDDDAPAVAASDNIHPQPDDETGEREQDVDMGEDGIVPESQHDRAEQEEEEDDDDDEGPISRTRTRRNRVEVEPAAGEEPQAEKEGSQPIRRSTRRTAGKRSRPPGDDGSDFEPNEDSHEEEELSDSAPSQASPQKDDNGSGNERRSRLRNRHRYSNSRGESEAREIAEELAELKATRPRRKKPDIVYEDKPRRTRKSVDYRLIRPELLLPLEESEVEPAGSPSRRGGRAGGSTWQRTLFSTYGPFGGAGPTPLLGGPAGMGASGGVESDSSDDELAARSKAPGAPSGMTTTALAPSLGLGMPGQSHPDPAQAAPGVPANYGKIKDKQALADADPLGVNPNVNFDSVGGLQGHIDQLKEMVSLPLLYPEVFQSLNIIPPRGVLFHGPPGTGKTLLARALATSVSTEGRKVTFYMRKGADALSKWVGEAEKQLRLLFEEARRTQPSIIFFDEIDGLAPVRSSKQEQIHSSIVSTLLALMDGMDGRGQVIVIGATNRPDSVDPALRRPGRFDREFYFPLPNLEARRAIIDINTRGWEPALSDEFKDKLAASTKGYGGADLRALCTEAALNAVQRVYPQIYQSKDKLLIDPKKIKVSFKDFMISLNKIIPSSERSASSGASPLNGTVEPLLRDPLREIQERITKLLPRRKALTALEEAQFEQPNDDIGFKREKLQEEFDRSRVFRPRLLIRGEYGMGQQYITSALLNHFEGINVQSFDLPTLLSDSTRSPEAVVVQLFAEVKRNKPSVICIPNIRSWYETLGSVVISTFMGLLRSIPPTDPVLLLGILEGEAEYEANSDIVRNLFGYSKKNQYFLSYPELPQRREFFQPIINLICTAPVNFPDPDNRKKRVIEQLELAPPAPPKPPPAPTKEELKAQKRKDRQTLNLMKIRIQPIMDQIRKYKRFRSGVVDEAQIRYLYDDDDPNVVTSDLPPQERGTFRPYEKDTDKAGVPGLREVATGKFYYNLDIVTIEKRLSNGYYKRPKDFLADIKRLAKDAKQLGDPDRQLKANELLANVEVDIGAIDNTDPALVAECEVVYTRELERERAALEKGKQATANADGTMGPPAGPPPHMNIAHGSMELSNISSAGPVVLGELFNGPCPAPGNKSTGGFPSITNGNIPRLPPHGSVEGFRPPTSNGSQSKPAEGDGDVQMSNSDHTPGTHQNNTQNSSFGPSAQPRPPHSYTAPSQFMRNQSGLSTLSQKGNVTPMAPGSQPGDYVNDASTTQTTSEKKHSGPSDMTHSNPHNSVMASGVHDAPDLTLYPDRASGDEHLPETQQGDSSWVSSQLTPLRGVAEFLHSQSTASLANGSQSQPRHSQASQSHPPGPPPLFGAASSRSSAANTHGTPVTPPSRNGGSHRISDIVNSEPKQPEPPLPDLIIDEAFNNELHEDLSTKTGGCSIEQLEQINTELMDCLWTNRNEWNRKDVAVMLKSTFLETLEDIKSSQNFIDTTQKLDRQ
ncbi:TAT-binding protein-like protein 7, AAA ATPase [Microsporum ferrugineum]